MKIRIATASMVGLMTFWAPLQAHRIEGLLQSSLVEVLPSGVGVEVTLVLGIDIAPKIVSRIDSNGDGVFSDAESKAWSSVFLTEQSVTMEGHPLTLKLDSVKTSPLAEMTGGHGEIVVHFHCDFDRVVSHPCVLVCANRYEPILCTYQVNGLVPKSPGVRITSHRRDKREKEITLVAELSESSASAAQRPPATTRPAH